MRITFAQPQIKMRLQFVIILLNRLNRNLAQVLPGLTVFRVAVLQFGGYAAGRFFGVFIFFAADIGLFIKSGNGSDIISFRLGQIAVLFDNLCQNHSHRGSPVAKMDIGNYLIADKLLNPADSLADNR